MEFELLGGMRARRDGDDLDLGGPKPRAVLAALLVERGRTVRADRLVELVWGDAVPARAEGSLQAYVSNLRRVLEPDRRPREEPSVLVTRDGGYAVLVDRADLDIARLEDLAAEGHARLRAGDAAAAVVALDAALAEWRGPLLPELAHEPWVVEAARRLGRVRGQAVEDRAEAGLALGEPAAVVALLEGVVAEDRFHERLWSLLALALYRCGRQRDALAALAEARDALVDAGLEPGRELRDLEAAVLVQAPELDGAPRPTPAGPEPGAAPATTVAPVAPGPTSEREGAPVPGARGEERPFVGRRRELSALRDAFDAVCAGGPGRPVVVSGEPGIGKTRLVEELSARASGAVVAWARCPESAAQAAYWPCVQLGHQLAGAGVATEALGALLPHERAPGAGEPVADRLALHASVAELLASTDTPVVLVVDDLQWADPATLRLVEYVAGDLHRGRTLLVVTVRPVGPDAGAPLLDCLAEMARQPGAVRLDLHGLSAADVADWLRLRRAGPAEPEVAAVLHDRTGGNAFFLGEVVELLAAEGHLGDLTAARRHRAVPGAVHDVVRRRVGRLPADTQQLLSAASVVGRTFDLDVLAAVAGLDPGTVLDRLDPALDSGLVVESDHPGRLQFAHALVADALVAELSPLRRARAHARVARSLVELRQGDLPDEVAAIAHHAHAGIAAGTAEDAHRWSARAARSAHARGADDDAAEHWRRAADAAAVAWPRDVRPRHEALMAAGLSHLRVDSVAEAYECLVAAIDLGLAAGDPDLVGPPAAAMNVEGLWLAGEIALTAVDALGALERAVAFLPPEPTVERALALGAVAENAFWVRPVEVLDAVSAEAVAVARATGDREVLARSLHKRNQALWRAATFPERSRAAEDVMALVEGAPVPPDLEATALFGAASASWEAGDVALTTERVERARALAATTGTPALVTQLDFFRIALLTATGELRAAIALIEDVYELYRRTRRWAAEPFRAAYLTMALMDLGALDEIDAVAPAILDSGYADVFGEGLALALVELGQPERARAVVKPLPVLDDSWLFLGMVGAAAHTRVALGDTDSAAVIRQHLRPYAGRLAVPGTGPAMGDVDLALGRLDRLLGDEESARRHLDASVATLTRAGLVPWLVRALLERHDLVGDPADLERAAEALRGRELPVLAARLEQRRGGSK